MNTDIQIIFLDLDGTLLNSEKRLTARTDAALRRAAAKGIQIVPASGRLAKSILPVLGNPPYMRYVIAVNGSAVYDTRTDTVLRREEIPLEEVFPILDLLDRYPGIYDCYIDGSAYMNTDMLAHAADYTVDDRHLALVRDTRTPVADLRRTVHELGIPVQKCQIMFRNRADRDRALTELKELMPDYLYACTYTTNIEINSRMAHKGAALAFLCKYLGIPIEKSMSFGDSSNDISMLQTAGVGVVMGNAEDEMFRYGDLTAPGCDEDGVAQIIERYLL